jgi:hypothetical protein
MTGDGNGEHRAMLTYISHTPTDSWGFTIYRTVYMPGSDESFTAAIDKLNLYNRADLYKEPEPSDARKQLSDSIMAKCHHSILEDVEQFDQASPDDLRSHFLQSLSDSGKRLGSVGSENRAFIMIDEEVLNSITAAPDDPYEGLSYGPEWLKQRVKFVDAVYKPSPPAPAGGIPRGRGRGPPGLRLNNTLYSGWMYVTLRKVWFLWQRTFDDDGISG